ncbi:hypothetical protein SCAR479_13751 [Seiridium cardinale]|uniref:Uncharacterized protein n=1 Tax=Seiridium cardinale TaxID=138064 RepID=A0ABR2X764_9PEZI
MANTDDSPINCSDVFGGFIMVLICGAIAVLISELWTTPPTPRVGHVAEAITVIRDISYDSPEFRSRYSSAYQAEMGGSPEGSLSRAAPPGPNRLASSSTHNHYHSDDRKRSPLAEARERSSVEEMQPTIS